MGLAWIENPRVDGSIPSQATKLKSPFQRWLGLFCWAILVCVSPRRRLLAIFLQKQSVATITDNQRTSRRRDHMKSLTFWALLVLAVHTANAQLARIGGLAQVKNFAGFLDALELSK